jgi:hypothetical protein
MGNEGYEKLFAEWHHDALGIWPDELEDKPVTTWTGAPSTNLVPNPGGEGMDRAKATLDMLRTKFVTASKPALTAVALSLVNGNRVMDGTVEVACTLVNMGDAVKVRLIGGALTLQGNGHGWRGPVGEVVVVAGLAGLTPTWSIEVANMPLTLRLTRLAEQPPGGLGGFDALVEIERVEVRVNGTWQTLHDAKLLPDPMDTKAQAERDAVTNALHDAIPGLNARVTCPASDCEQNRTIWDMVQHLNDHHEWTREAIADWSETLDADLTVSDEPPKHRPQPQVVEVTYSHMDPEIMKILMGSGLPPLKLDGEIMEDTQQEGQQG